MHIYTLVLTCACLSWQIYGLAQDESEPRGLLARKRGPLVKGKTTTTTTPAPQEEIEYEDEEYTEDEVQELSTETPPSSTEGKKLVAGGVRPFRSNTDLLEALKRRRAQVAEAKLHGHSSTAASVTEPSTEGPVKASSSKKRYNSPQRENGNNETPTPAKINRNRFGRPSTRAAQEPELEEKPETPPAPVRTGRTFRKGN